MAAPSWMPVLKAMCRDSSQLGRRPSVTRILPKPIVSARRCLSRVSCWRISRVVSRSGAKPEANGNREVIAAGSAGSFLLGGSQERADEARSHHASPDSAVRRSSSPGKGRAVYDAGTFHRGTADFSEGGRVGVAKADRQLQ